MSAVYQHRATLKQQNKPFKSRHKTKGQLKDSTKGRVQRQSAKALRNPQNVAAQLRQNRRNLSKQLQAQKRAEMIDSSRIFSGVDGTPRIVAVVPLSDDVSAASALKAILSPLGLEKEILECIPSFGSHKVKVHRFKTSLQALLLPYRSFYATLDAAKAADYVIFVLSTQVEVDTWGDTLLRCLQAQGLATVITVASDSSINTSTMSKKDRAGTIKSLLSFIQYFFPSQHRVFDLGPACASHQSNFSTALNQNECLSALRGVCEGRPVGSAVKWRDGRMWLVADTSGVFGASITWEEYSQQAHGIQGEKESRGTLGVTGTIRGAPLSANRLIHIPNYGDFQIEKIVDASISLRHSKKSSTDAMDVEPSLTPTILEQQSSSSNMKGDHGVDDDDDIDSLTSRLEPDTMQNEQTWPTEEEMNGNLAGQADEKPVVRKGVKKVRVPRGTSTYQAAWIVDDSANEDDEREWESESEESAEQDLMEDEPVEAFSDQTEELEELEELSVQETKGAGAFKDLDREEEDKQLELWRKTQADARARKQEHNTDLEFPDEIDTPIDIPARQRFARYRGLRSFRTSPWDPFENLPLDYARIFMLEDYKRIERSVRRKAEIEGVLPGTRVTVFIKDVPRSLFTLQTSSSSPLPLLLFGLFKYEHKHSVAHFNVQRNTEYTDPVRSKDPLMLCVGARRYRVSPIYSEHRTGKGNGIYKFHRYLRHGGTSVATIFGPIAFGRQSCSLLREGDDPQEPKLVATGSFTNADPKRIIAKRIILTGHPYKIHKKTATIRYMFFNPDDVKYFSPVQLRTKLGRRGHISESLGTHGYFKAHFDAPITQMDTICLNLYKRVFPKWSQIWVDPNARPTDELSSTDTEV